MERLSKYTDYLKQTFAASSLTQEDREIEIEELENIINLIDTIEPSGRVS